MIIYNTHKIVIDIEDIITIADYYFLCSNLKSYSPVLIYCYVIKSLRQYVRFISGFGISN